MRKYIFILLLATALMTSCGSADSPNTAGSTILPSDVDGGAASMNLSIGFASQPSTVKSFDEDEVHATDAAGGTVVVTEARAVVEKIELEMPDGMSCEDLSFSLTDVACDDSPEDLEESEDVLDDASMAKSTDDAEDETEDGSETENDEIEFKGPFLVDLMTGLATPSLVDLIVPSGIYKEVELKLAPLDEDSPLVELDDPLIGHSLLVKGTYDDGSSVRTFLVALKIDTEIEFEHLDGFPVLESVAVNDLIISLDVSSWFQDLNIGACLDSGDVMPDTDGVYVITEETPGDACEIEELLEASVEDSSSAEIDDDDSSDDASESAMEDDTSSEESDDESAS